MLFSLIVVMPLIVAAQMIKSDCGAYWYAYDLSLQCPQQILWTLHREDIGNIKREPSWRFVSDMADPRAVANHADYNKSGYHRGHLCPAADRSGSVLLMRRTFAMSNIAPQTASLNLGSWKRTETDTRLLLSEFDSVRVLVLPVFLPTDTTYIGRHRLAVPHAFFKAVWDAESDSVLRAWFIFNR